MPGSRVELLAIFIAINLLDAAVAMNTIGQIHTTVKTPVLFGD
jgi:hypothetical protein